MSSKTRRPDVVDMLAALEQGRPPEPLADEDQTGEDKADEDQGGLPTDGSAPAGQAAPSEAGAPAPSPSPKPHAALAAKASPAGDESDQPEPPDQPEAQPEDQADEALPPLTPSLSLWRTVPADELVQGLRADDLVSFLLPLTPSAEPRGNGTEVAIEPSPVEATSADHYAQIALQLLGFTNRDLAASWLLAAVLANEAASRTAAILLVGQLVALANPRPMWLPPVEPEDDRLMAVAASWLPHCTLLSSSVPILSMSLHSLVDNVGLKSIARDLGFAARRRRIDLDFESPPSILSRVREQTQAQAQPPAEPPTRGRTNLLGGVASEGGAPVLTVVPQGIGDPSSTQGKEARQRFSSLLSPLPLAIAPPVDALAGALVEEFPWMSEAIAALRDDLTMRARAGLLSFRLRPTLLVGPPGCGKTRFARRLAQLIGTGVGEVAAAGSSDSRLLAGTARGWHSAAPSLPVQVIHRSGKANPIMVIDELEKAGGSGRNGDVRATLLGLLEPETARAFPDEYLMSGCDLSQVTWLMTANETGPIPRPLLSRLRVVEVEPPSPRHWAAILASLRRDIAQELGIDAADLPALARPAEATLREAFEGGASVRRIKAALERALAAAEPDSGPQLH